MRTAMSDFPAIPLMNSTISAGFPSPAGDYREEKLDLSRYLVSHPAATYFLRVRGDSMKDAGILDGDILIVDRSLSPQNRSIVIAELNGELTVKRLKRENGQTFLVAANENYHPILVRPEDDFAVWGVVSGSFRSY